MYRNDFAHGKADRPSCGLRQSALAAVQIAEIVVGQLHRDAAVYVSAQTMTAIANPLPRRGGWEGVER